KSTNRLADASTQTEERVKEKGARKTCRRSFSIDSGTVESITNDSPPSSSGTCSSATKTDTLESLMKADGERTSFMGIKSEDKQYFSGSLVETKSVKEEGMSSLKRSSSYNAN
nr:hypothetical protein [Tanacetum cinerariifolium]